MNESELLREALKEDPRYEEALNLVRQNADGKIWLVGGIVYKNLVNKLDSLHIPVRDLDFVVERSNDAMRLPSEWTYHENVFGDTRFVSPNYVIDFIPLPRSYHIRYKKLEPTIENYLKGASLSVQAIAFDIATGEIVDGGGLESIKKKTISVHNPMVLKYYCNRKDINPNTYIKDRAEQLGFTPELMDA